MKIAIQAADLDSQRIDGTRVYILNLLKYFGKLDSSSDFLIYHKKDFNPELAPPEFPNYKIIRKNLFYIWTQTRFAMEIWKDKPDILWMPMQALPIIRRKNLKTVITVHDLAFKIFPDQFTKNDLRRLNFYADYAIKRADKIIAVSQSTKKDIFKFYPKINGDKIKVIYHGFNSELYSKKYTNEEIKVVNTKYKIPNTRYLLYVGAIQPRKNLKLLVEAVEKLKEDGKNSDLKLVLVGKPAWMADDILKRINDSSAKKDIILAGQINFKDLSKIYQGASAFIFPSLYEGFGIPILEAFSSEIPVVCANNSSLPEVGGDAVLYFENNSSQDLAIQIEKVLSGEEIKKDLVVKGLLQLQKFSWEKCARETLKYMKGA
jgi:glycosyltransferase involved in cell wall biosynthesis